MSERQSFQLTLKHGSEEETRTAVLEAAQGASAVSAVFENLPKGTYTLQVAAKGIEHMSRYFRWTGMIKAFSCILVQHRSCLDVQPGLLAYAASNVQIKDFVDALDRGSADSIYDINQDGTVDLADLQRLYDERREYKQQTSL
ncbi:MAG: hypothetical protein ACLRL6_01675 [Clostridium sp.]